MKIEIKIKIKLIYNAKYKSNTKGIWKQAI